MRRFFIGLFIVSIIATGATYAWRTYAPESTTSRPFSSQSGDRETRSTNGEFARRFSDRQIVEQAPSDRQDLALTISIFSSVISALAAVFQTWLTARSHRQ